VPALAFAPDGQRVAAGCQYYDRANNTSVFEVRVWETGTGKELWQVKLQNGYLFRLAFSADGRLLAGAGQGQSLTLWDAASGREYRRAAALAEGGYPTATPVFAPDGRTLAVAVAAADGKSGHIQVWELLTGQVRQEFGGTPGQVTALAFSADGRTLAAGGTDTTITLWDATGRASAGRGLKAVLTEKELEELWQELGSTDAPTGHRAILKLAAAPKDSLPLLKKHVKPVARGTVTAEQIARLVADLDADGYAAREKATKELEQVGEAARAALVKALAGNPSVEVRRRAEGLLEKLNAPGPAPELLRPLRAVEVLERSDSPEARAWLQALAEGDPNAQLTQDARAALSRLGQQTRKP
jgi:hypothetical protein